MDPEVQKLYLPTSQGISKEDIPSNRWVLLVLSPPKKNKETHKSVAGTPSIPENSSIGEDVTLTLSASRELRQDL